MSFRLFLIFFNIFLFAVCSHALTDENISVGVGYFSQNFMGETAQKPDGSSGFLGAANYGIDLGYEAGLAKNWFWSVRLLYTPLPRAAEGSTADITLTHLKFLGGQNFEGLSSKGSKFDWFVGLGILKEDLKGKGGLVQLNNGTGTATFAVPGNSSSTLNGTQSAGIGYSFGEARVAGEIVFENLFSQTKRTQSLLISILYSFQQKSRGPSK